MTLWDNYRALRRRPAETFSEFLFGEEYLALPESEIYPGVITIGNEIYEKFLNNEIDAAFVLAGLGSGKSTMASLLVCAVAHWLLCFRDPHEHFGLLPDKPLVIPCMGVTAGQVRDVVFGGIRGFLNDGPFFRQFTPVIRTEPDLPASGTSQRVLTTRATFKRNVGGSTRRVVEILAGNSVENYPLGLNTFVSVIDELSKFRDSEGKSQAKLIFETLDQRRLSRFGEASHNGLIICVGTAGTEGEYVDRKLKASASDPKTYIRRARTWEMKGRSRYKGGMFHFVKRDLGPKGVKYECLDEAPKADGVTLHLPDVPDVFRKVFERDPMLALRDFASISSLAISPWDMNAEAVVRLANLDRGHPLFPNTLEPKDWFRGESGVEYYLHVDLALNREGKGDCAGLCLAHCCGEKRVLVAEVGAEKVAGGDRGGTLYAYDQEVMYEFRPVTYVDLMLRWTSGEAGEILFSEIREFIYKLMSWGFDCSGRATKWDQWGKPTEFTGGVTYDGFQSADSLQLLWEHGVCAGLFSVDRTTGPYEDLRASIQDGRLDFYPYETELDGLPARIFEHEYKRLSLVKKGGGYKVDHSPQGSKDVADAVCGVVSRITLDHKRASGGFVP